MSDDTAPMADTSPGAQQTAAPRRRWRPDATVLAAVGVFLGSALYYGFCLYPGHGGELNAGDSVKFQILGHTPILVHGPGYPLVLLIGAAVRALALPVPPWWTMTFALSAIPGALANTFAFALTRHLTGSIGFGLAAALLLGSTGLIAVQATEAEVYALTLAFVLGIALLLVLFVTTHRPGYFLAACAAYALSFGNHLMMIMLLIVFAVVVVVYRGQLVRPRYAAVAAAFIALGACQYLYLALVAYDPATAYSEYMALPPEPMALVHYILGTYFSELYGSGLSSTRTLEALISTLRSAHPWVSAPLISAGVVLAVAGWRRRDARWRGLALVFAAGLSFVPFVLWYGAYDIRAFHGPVLGPLLVAAVAAVGWQLRRSPVLRNACIVVLVLAGSVRAGQTAWLLGTREAAFPGVGPAVTDLVSKFPAGAPVVAMSYGLRMTTLYYELLGEVPQSAHYSVHWRAISRAARGQRVGGIVVPTDGYQFVRWIQHHRPDLACHTEKIHQPEGARWPAYRFDCRSRVTTAAARRTVQGARSATSVNP